MRTQSRFLILLCMICSVGFFASNALAQIADTPEETPDEPEKLVSPLLVEPKTPEELFAAVDLMLRLAQPKLARKYLQQLMDANPGDDVLNKIRDKQGVATFIKFSNTDALKPLSIELLNKSNDAFRKRGADPKRIDKLINDLRGGAEQREVALIALRNAGPVVMPQMIVRLGEAREKNEKDLLLYALVQMGPQNIPAILGALAIPEDNLRSSLIDVLGRIGNLETTNYLWYHAFGDDIAPSVQNSARNALKRIFAASDKSLSAYGVSRTVRKIAYEHFRNQYNWHLEDSPDGKVDLWTWPPGADTIKLNRVSPAEASLYVGSRLARQAWLLAPDDTENRAFYLAYILAAARGQVPLENPLPGDAGSAYRLALRAGSEIANQALKIAMKNGNTRSATELVRVLGENESIRNIYSATQETSPLLAALDYPDPQVQFAAATAIMTLDPEKPFRKDNRVVEILTRALEDDGSSKAVVVHPNVTRANIFASLLKQMGYDATIARTGRDGFQIASHRQDINLVVLNINTARWPLSQTIANFRADSRTANIPLVLYGPARNRSDLAPVLKYQPKSTYVIESTTSENLQSQLQPFLNAVSQPQLSAKARAEQRKAAAYWLASIASSQRTDIFDLKAAESALYDCAADPNMMNNCLLALTAIPTPSVQAKLYSLITKTLDTPELQEQAAWQLAHHISKHGLMLTKLQVNELKLLINSSDNPQLVNPLSVIAGLLQPDANLINQLLKAHTLTPLQSP